jgi:hypothetical protein
MLNKEISEELIAYFPLIRHGPNRARRLQQSYSCECIRCRSNDFTEQFPGIDTRIHVDTQTDMRDL